MRLQIFFPPERAARAFRRARATEAAAQRVFFPSAAGDAEIKPKIKAAIEGNQFPPRWIFADNDPLSALRAWD